MWLRCVHASTPPDGRSAPPCRLYHCYCYLAIAFLRWIGLTCTSLPPCVPQTPRFAEAGRAFLNFALTTFCVVRADCLAWCRHHHHRRRHRLRCFCFRFRFLLFDTHASPSLSCVPPHPPPSPTHRSQLGNHTMATMPDTPRSAEPMPSPPAVATKQQESVPE